MQTATDKIYLNVPYEEKDKAKAIGARWDADVKRWYYTNPDDERRFRKWKDMALSVSMLSEEQQELVALAKNGDNVLVDACIGSGKTTTIQVLCNELSDRNILYLTYNTLLKVDAKEKIRGRNVFVTNYHGFAYKCLADAHISAGVSDLIQTFLNNKDRISVPRYDLLVIDEYQDIEQEIAEMLECIKKANPYVQIIAVGDMKQKIYDKTTLDVKSFINNFLGEHTLLSFTRCFRLSADIATRLGNIWEKPIIGVNPKCRVEYMKMSDVVFFLSTKKPSDILCLGSRTGKMSETLNQLEKDYPKKFNKSTVYASINDEDRGRTIPNKETAIFTTFDSSKGLERKICVVFDYDDSYWQMRSQKPDVKWEILRNIFCVAASRGKERIIFAYNDKGGETKENNFGCLADKTIATPFGVKTTYDKPFNMSDMFSFKYKEDVEACYNLLKIERVKAPENAVTDNSVINVKTNDELIDLAPCVGNLQEATFFKNYDIMQVIEAAEEENRKSISVPRKENATLEDLILYLTAVETHYVRYVMQVQTPFVSEETLGEITDRLKTVFTPFEEVQRPCEVEVFDEKTGNVLMINGRCDVVKDNTVYELKFIEELKHENFLQCACYMYALKLDKGVLWNVRNNERFTVEIPDRNRFFRAVINAITKGTMESPVDVTTNMATTLEEFIAHIRQSANKFEKKSKKDKKTKRKKK
jgi:hypothetical protein